MVRYGWRCMTPESCWRDHGPVTHKTHMAAVKAWQRHNRRHAYPAAAWGGYAIVEG